MVPPSNFAAHFPQVFVDASTGVRLILQLHQLVLENITHICFQNILTLCGRALNRGSTQVGMFNVPTEGIFT